MGQFEYHFNLGDQKTLGIGCCARIYANSRKQAVENFKSLLDQDGTLDVGIDQTVAVYLHVYFGLDKITVDAIDFVEDGDGNEVDYETTCPHCGAEDELYIIEANGVEMHELLESDGFNVPSEVAVQNGRPEDYSTTDEKVQCNKCGCSVEFSELMV